MQISANECLDTPHTYPVLKTTMYSVLYAAMYSVLYNKLYPDNLVAGGEDLFPE